MARRLVFWLVLAPALFHGVMGVALAPIVLLRIAYPPSAADPVWLKAVLAVYGLAALAATIRGVWWCWTRFREPALVAN
jgi:hypothetical protein